MWPGVFVLRLDDPTMRPRGYLDRLNEWRVVFFEVGLIVALGSALLILNWETVDSYLNEPVAYDPDWDRAVQVEDHTPRTRQRTFTPPPDVVLEHRPLSGSIETILEGLLEETEMASTEISGGNDVAIPASAFRSSGSGTGVALPADEVEAGENEVFVVVEDMPQFPGGDEALLKYLYSQLIYPRLALEYKIEGRVVVQFVIAANGRIEDVAVLRGIGFGCDEEALRVVKGMPAWTPGRQRGRAVRVRYNLPILFRMRTPESLGGR
jgi:protein TonB